MNGKIHIEGIFKCKHHQDYIMEIKEDDDERYPDLFVFNLLEPENRELFKRTLERIGQNRLIGPALTIEYPDEEFSFFYINEEPIAMFELKGRCERIANSSEELE